MHCFTNLYCHGSSLDEYVFVFLIIAVFLPSPPTSHGRWPALPEPGSGLVLPVKLSFFLHTVAKALAHRGHTILICLSNGHIPFMSGYDERTQV